MPEHKQPCNNVEFVEEEGKVTLGYFRDSPDCVDPDELVDFYPAACNFRVGECLDTPATRDALEATRRAKREADNDRDHPPSETRPTSEQPVSRSGASPGSDL